MGVNHEVDLVLDVVQKNEARNKFDKGMIEYIQTDSQIKT